MLKVRNCTQHPIVATAYDRVNEQVVAVHHSFPPGDSEISEEKFRKIQTDFHFDQDRFQGEPAHLMCLNPPRPSSKNARSPEEIQEALKKLQAQKLAESRSASAPDKNEAEAAQKAALDAEARAAAAEKRAQDAEAALQAAEAKASKAAETKPNSGKGK
jgi:uncharacterized membrane protein YqiK